MRHAGPDGHRSPLPKEIADSKCVILVGGTFDPPHVGHVRLPEEARRSAGLEDAFLLFVPASRNPLKELGPSAGDEERIAMLSIAIQDLPRAGLWTDELDRSPGRPSYTIDTVRRLRSALSNDVAIRLLIGADQALVFHQWREASALVESAPPIVMLRGTDRHTLLQQLVQTGRWTENQQRAWGQGIVSTPQLNISSTRLRALLSRSRDEAEESELLDGIDARVLAYIMKYGLYQT